MRADERFANPVGVLQGGFLAAFADSSMGAASVTNAGDRKVFSVNAEMKIDPEGASEDPLPDGTIGELIVRTEGEDGWTRTGDLVSRDADGYFYAHGRMSETIDRLLGRERRGLGWAAAAAAFGLANAAGLLATSYRPDEGEQ